MKRAVPISKKESLFEVIITVLFTALLFILFLKPDLLAIYQRGGKPIPMLIASSAKSLISGLLLFSLMALAVSMLKLWKKHWSTPLVWTSCLSELASSLYFIFFITRWDALTKGFIRFFRNDLATWQIIAKAAGACFLLLTLISIADDLYKAYRHKEKS